MADVKVSALTELSAQPDAGDTLYIIDGGSVGVGGADKIIQYSNLVPDASATVKGKVELATSAETTTGTDTGRAVTPDGLAGSNFGIRYAQIQVTAPDGATSTGDGAAYFVVPAALNGMDLVSVHAYVVTAPTGSAETYQIHNLTDTVDMLSTEITIDATENGSDTAATPAVINTSNDDVATNDVLRIDIDGVGSSSAAEGLIVTLGFQLP